MCRMLAARFVAGASEVAGELLGCLAEASRSDPYLAAIAGDGRHCHGYGYVAALRRGRAWRLMHERFDAEPVLSGEEACAANLEALDEAVKRLSGILEAGWDEVAILLHSRRTRGEPRGQVAAHPFREEVTLSTERGAEVSELYLSHNGGVEKARLAELIGLGDSSIYTDSHVFLKYLARRLEGAHYLDAPSAIASVVAESKPYVKSALDICILLNVPSAGPMLAAAAYVAEKDDPRRWRYYEPVLVESEGLAGYVSSTVRDLARSRGLGLRFVDGRDGFLAVLNPGRLEIRELF
jgi:glutamine amidotransferase